MTRLIRDYLDINDQPSLDRLIDSLIAIRDGLPAGATDAQVRLRGDDIFGRRLTVSFLRPLTSEEAALEARYGPARLELAA